MASGADKAVATIGMLLVASVALGVFAYDTPISVEDPWQRAGQALVVSSHPDATAAGLTILEAGGNAVDAAAAVQFALNVVEPMMSGIGGGAFLLLYDAESRTLAALDGREVAPAAASPDMFQQAMLTGDTDPRERGIAVGVPGTLAVWDSALREHGSMDLPQVVAPAIRLAAEGFVVDAVTSEYIERSADKLRRWPAAAELFLPGAQCPPQAASQLAAAGEWVAVPCTGGSALAPGDHLVQPSLAAALGLVADRGVAALYDGPLGQALVDTVTQRGGIVTRQDLASYAVVERGVLLRPWREYQVATLGLPSGGLVVQEALAILEPLAVAPRSDAAAAHRVVEAMHLAFADRGAYMADPKTALATPQQLLHPDFIASRRAKIDPDRTGAPFAPGRVPGSLPAAQRDPVAPGLQTTHFTVMDESGNIVAATSTLESVFGSGMLVPEYGFFLNNEMTDFDLQPGGPNQVGPGKRPLSSMSPTIVLDDAGPVLALGSPGGSTIQGTLVQVMLDVLVDGAPLQDAVDAPRWAARTSPQLQHEAGLPAALIAGLRERGHDWSEVGRIGGVQAIHFDGAWSAAADERRAGSYGSI